MRRSETADFRLTRREALGAGAAALALGASGLSTRAKAADQELNILVWCDHTDATLLEPFEKANNCRINVKDYQETGAALAVLDGVEVASRGTSAGPAAAAGFGGVGAR